MFSFEDKNLVDHNIILIKQNIDLINQSCMWLIKSWFSLSERCTFLQKWQKQCPKPCHNDWVVLSFFFINFCSKPSRKWSTNVPKSLKTRSRWLGLNQYLIFWKISLVNLWGNFPKMTRICYNNVSAIRSIVFFLSNFLRKSCYLSSCIY